MEIEIMHFVLALKIKLMVRRPIAQLVDQGIIPCEYPIEFNN